MIINTNAWHFKWYEFSYWGPVPRSTNLCQYVRRVILVAPIMGVLTLGLFFLFLLSIVLGIIFMPFFGYLPTRWSRPWEIYDRGGTYKYPTLQLGSSYNAFRIYPWHVILLAAVVWVEVIITQAFGYHPLIVQGEILGVILAIVGIPVVLILYYSSSTGKVVNQYLSAKKQKVCPIVEFKNEE